MSSKGRLRESQPRDKYLTPRSLVDAALSKLKSRYPSFQPETCLEPGCAWGVHLDYALKHFPSIIYTAGIDLEYQPVAPEHDFIWGDFLRWETDQRFDLIVTNPPFTLAESFLLKAKSLLTPNGVGLFFHRYGFFTTQTRRYGLWSQVNLREVWVCVRRPAMIGQSTTDSCEYSYYLFDPSSALTDYIRLDWLDWEDSRHRQG